MADEMNARTARDDYEVVIAGGGPVGLWLACELRLKGVSVLVVEAKAERSTASRAGALHCRSLEVFDMRGIAEIVLDNADRGDVVHFAGLTNQIRITDVDSRHAFSAFVSQRRVEDIFQARALELGAEIIFGTEVTGYEQDAGSVRVTVVPTGAPTIEVSARYLVGCDGGGSTVRKLAGIQLEGMRGEDTSFFGDVILDNPPSEPRATMHNEEGSLIFSRWADGSWRVVRLDSRRSHISRDEPVTLEELKESVFRASGIDYGIRDPSWMARITNTSARAGEYRNGRVLLAGDAAHLHPPMGGQGLNLGLQDVNNLGWKLAGVIQGTVPDEVLDSYAVERMPIADGVIENCRAQHAISIASGLEGEAVRELLNRAISDHEDFARDLAVRTIAFGVRYPPRTPESHPLVGQRARDVDLRQAPADRLYELLRGGNFVLLNATGDRLDLPTSPLVDQYDVALIDAAYGWQNITAALIRPDGYVAWASEATDSERVTEELRQELPHWVIPIDAPVLTGSGTGAAR